MFMFSPSPSQSSHWRKIPWRQGSVRGHVSTLSLLSSLQHWIHHWPRDTWSSPCTLWPAHGKESAVGSKDLDDNLFTQRSCGSIWWATLPLEMTSPWRWTSTAGRDGLKVSCSRAARTSVLNLQSPVYDICSELEIHHFEMELIIKYNKAVFDKHV